MPDFLLNSQERNALVAYILSLRWRYDQPRCSVASFLIGVREMSALCRAPLIAWIRSLGARAAARELWLSALCVIAWRLNGRVRLKHRCRTVD